MPTWLDVADGRRVRFRPGRAADALPMAAALLSNGMNPLGALRVDASRFVVCESAAAGGAEAAGEARDRQRVVGFAQIRLLATSGAPDPSMYDARPGSADWELDADDDAWEDLEREVGGGMRERAGGMRERGLLSGGLVMPWSAAYRELDERAAVQRARRRARIAQAAASAAPLWELASVFVEREWRGVGVGTALVQRLLEAHQSEGRSVAALYLLTLEPTAGWYEESFGFRTVAKDRAPQQMALEMAAGEALSAILGNRLVCMRGSEEGVDAAEPSR